LLNFSIKINLKIFAIMSQPDASSGGHYAQEKEFFKSLVSLALADGKITHEEYDMLYIVGKKVGASPEEVDTIIKSAGDQSPVSKADDVTNQKRLINLIRMMWADGEMDEKELQLVQKFSEGLGFERSQVQDLVQKISRMVVEDRAEHEILAAIK
jgi:uncharacterized tellurite resistance protein B-like protein